MEHGLVDPRALDGISDCPGADTKQPCVFYHPVTRAERDLCGVIPALVHQPGDEAQVDLFEVTVDIGGERIKAWKFVMRLMYSGRDFARHSATRFHFLDGHGRAFTHFDSVPIIVFTTISCGRPQNCNAKTKDRSEIRGPDLSLCV